MTSQVLCFPEDAAFLKVIAKWLDKCFGPCPSHTEENAVNYAIMATLLANPSIFDAIDEETP